MAGRGGLALLFFGLLPLGFGGQTLLFGPFRIRLRFGLLLLPQRGLRRILLLLRSRGRGFGILLLTLLDLARQRLIFLGTLHDAGLQT